MWLASYPRLGNTWTRIFLANYLFTRTSPMPINQVYRLGMADSVEKAYRMVAGGPFDVSDYHQSLALRSRVLMGIAGNGADMKFVRTHNQRGNACGVELIPSALTSHFIHRQD